MSSIANRRAAALCAKLGHKGAIVSRHDRQGRTDLRGFLGAVSGTLREEVGIPIHVHLAGGGTHSLSMKPGSWRSPAFVAIVPMQLDETLSGMIFSGIARETTANVKFVMGEAGLGWIPYVVERLDHELAQVRAESDGLQDLDAAERDLCKRQVYTTYEDETARLGATAARSVSTTSCGLRTTRTVTAPGRSRAKRSPSRRWRSTAMRSFAK